MDRQEARGRRSRAHRLRTLPPLRLHHHRPGWLRHRPRHPAQSGAPQRPQSRCLLHRRPACARRDRRADALRLGAPLVFCCDAPHHLGVFNELKGGDPMSSDFVFHNVSSADCTSGKQSSR
ncbi:hypothetical protein MPL1032_100189 [Mesorhizobium plurifarium]|uniref:Uncharacterized protein n=1 Tax=Mesorhizobium plurifarium TaxID=69974 RepID=A0A0K2VPB7_MESPL|nr:hypothetical protein MPL1032_100189 [Mesorhizobium plurifarium]